MIPIPTGEQKLIPFANELIETCRISQGARAAYYRLLNTIAERILGLPQDHRPDKGVPFNQIPTGETR